ncbi:putative disease resistance protein RGA3 [Magnolia sinica]|uniref:putative disease resistance protein RGA3 n=1 Tax=Magnolia sinica TaxID=86752 RepID=UPI0026598E7F|nr:putative disease resistance protein RGA3 [Magnolia sinica]
MAYPLVSNVAEKLNNLIQDEVALLVGVTDEIKKLSRTFTLIQAVLKDAETRRSQDEAVKIWLQNVKDVAYDVDDILDEWMIKALKSQAPDEGIGSSSSMKKVRSFLSSVTSINHLKLRHKIGNKIKEVRGRLRDIAEEKNQLGLRADSGEGERVVSELRQGEIRSERETSSLVNPSSVIGREGEKNEVIGLLLQEVTEVPFVISIVGMGGLGKTTLAQLIYNDEKVEGFDMKMWVCVSEHFDVKQITKSIIKSADGSINCDHQDLDHLQRLLRGMLKAKRFLLVLDDVWSKDSEKWEKLILPFQDGAPGSRIIVTTRIEDVAGMMGSTDHMHKLAVLSDEDCWLLFRSKALEHRSEEERSELEEIGRQIVKKCAGVPLAAKTIGSVMHLKTRSQWELVLRSEMWNSGDVFDGILPALLLSYYDLPPALKQCFAYCSVFPKDWLIEKDMIVKLWVAQGFICSINGSEDMEEIGEQYFVDLLRRSLLQDAEIGRDGSIFRCRMHDLVHDLAQHVAGSDFAMVGNLNNVRHCFLVGNDETGDEAHKAASISATLHQAHKLRTLILGSKISMVPDNLFHHLRHLRALDLSLTDIEKFPQTVGQLKHLRYLDLSDTDIEELPEELSNCINLQILRLNYCDKLTKLPRGMRKMIRLRHLEFDYCYGLSYLPEGIGRLTELRTLTKFIVAEDDQGCKWGELKHLNHLQGSLRISGLQNVRSRDEASEAELHEKQHLRALSLECDDDVYGKPLDDEVKRMEGVLESLQPHTNLKELEIMSYKGFKLPKWMGDPIFSNLVKIGLRYCPEGKQLPGLGKLPALKYLFIRGMVEVKKVGGEFSGDDQNDGSGGGGVSFPKLETLCFEEMPNWEEWELRGGDGEVMPSLLKLDINDCPKLKALHLPVLPNLNCLRISNFDELTSLPVGSLPVELGQLRALTLDLGECPQLESLPVELGQLNALQTLQINYCPQLESLPEDLGQLKALQTLQIWTCPQLESLPKELGQLKALQTLEIYDCPQLESLPKELGQLKALQTLEISYCPQLESLPKELGQLKALQTLEISYCPELRSLPEELQHLIMLQQLTIYGCPVLEERCQDGGEDHHKIAHIRNINIHPCE